MEGVAQFNRREFFACHETLEGLWKRERGEIRDLYQGILQVAVGLYHLERGNHRGALYSLRHGTVRLRHFAPHCQGIDVGRLAEEADRIVAALDDLGPERTADFDLNLLPIVQLAPERPQAAQIDTI